jgi:hypothetical protein
MFSGSLVAAKQGRPFNQEVAAFLRARNHLVRPAESDYYTLAGGRDRLQPSTITKSFSRGGGNAMDALWNVVVAVGHAIEAVLVYVETHHWIFGFLAGGYIFYLHDRGLHARFDALDKRVDEIRKRLAIDY